jgi:hypothetical protein
MTNPAIAANYPRREPGLGEQLQCARVSALYGDHLTEQAAEAGVPTVTARPWTDAIERVVTAVTGTQ